MEKGNCWLQPWFAFFITELCSWRVQPGLKFKLSPIQMWWSLKLWICTNICFESALPSERMSGWVLLVYCLFIGSLLKHLTLHTVFVVPLAWHWLNITLSSRGFIQFGTLSRWFVIISSINDAAAEARIRLNYNYQTISGSPTNTRCLFCLALVWHGDAFFLHENLCLTRSVKRA